ncbi:MAG: glycosyltransferase [Thermoanaerobaculia bacterium]
MSQRKQPDAQARPEPGNLRVTAFATQGSGGSDEERLLRLLQPLGPEVIQFDRRKKLSSAVMVLRFLQRTRPHAVVMEGTGWLGGAALLAARLALGVRYFVSSGDAVGPFLGLRSRILAPLGTLYERILYGFSEGFVGWTPYLAGRALTLGARRAMSAPGWGVTIPAEDRSRWRTEVRDRLGVRPGTIVAGIAGTLTWVERRHYCYGLELVRAAAALSRDDVAVMIVGDGSGLPRLRNEAARARAGAVVFTGRVPREEVPKYLAAMDIGCLPQSCDGVGSFRYTWKLIEYLAAGIPVVSTMIPAAYDLDAGWIWRLPGNGPWEDQFVDALAAFLNEVRFEELETKTLAASRMAGGFDVEEQSARLCAFVRESLRGRVA